MISYTGAGPLAVIIWIGSLCAAKAFIDAGPDRDSLLPYMVAQCFGAVVIYVVGRVLNDKEIKHTLGDVRMEYWAFIMIGLDAVGFIAYYAKWRQL